MGTRSVDAPDKTFLTSVEAAEWLSWEESTFKRIVAEESAWLREAGVRGQHGTLYYHWMDIVVLGHLYAKRPLPGGEDVPVEPEQPPRKQSKRKKSTENPGVSSQPSGTTQPPPSPPPGSRA